MWKPLSLALVLGACVMPTIHVHAGGATAKAVSYGGRASASAEAIGHASARAEATARNGGVATSNAAASCFLDATSEANTVAHAGTTASVDQPSPSSSVYASSGVLLAVSRASAAAVSHFGHASSFSEARATWITEPPMVVTQVPCRAVIYYPTCYVYRCRPVYVRACR